MGVDDAPTTGEVIEVDDPNHATEENSIRPKRAAAVRAREKITQCIDEMGATVLAREHISCCIKEMVGLILIIPPQKER